MLPHQSGDSIVDFIPELMRGHGLQFTARHFHRWVHLPLVTDLHDGGVRPATSGKKMRDQLNGFLRCRKANANRRPAGEGFQALERKRQMRAPLVVRDGMDFIDDHRLNGFEDLTAFFCSQQNVERFRRRDQDVGRAVQHGPAVMHQGIAGAHGGANLRKGQPARRCQLQDFSEWNHQVLLYVVSQSFQGRNVENLSFISEFARERLSYQTIDADQESRQRLSRTGGR